MKKQNQKHTASSIYKVLKARIINWEYPPGKRLTETSLCDEFHVSRIPVREALGMLTEQKMVDKTPNIGCSVRKLTMSDINNLYDLRFALELYAVAATAGQENAAERIAPLRIQWEHFLKTAADPIDAPFWLEADCNFHKQLADLKGNPFLSAQLQQIDEQLRFIRNSRTPDLQRIKKMCAQHLAILEAVSARNPEEAHRLMRVNLEQTRSYVREELKEALMRAYGAN